MKLSTLWWAFVVVLLAGNVGAAEPSTTPEPRPQQATRAKREQPKLTDESVRAQDRLYRKTPQGELYLHFFFPPDWKAGDTRPAIVFFFGGAWRTGSYRAFVPQ